MRRMMQDTLLALAAMLILAAGGGCSLVDFDRGAGRAARPVTVVGDSVARAEPVVAALEDATGRTIDPATAGKGARIAGVTARVARTGAGIAAGLGQPGIAGLLGALAGLAGAVGAFFQRRKARALAMAASRAADRVQGGGRALIAAAAEAGVADEVSRAYSERKAAS